VLKPFGLRREVREKPGSRTFATVEHQARKQLPHLTWCPKLEAALAVDADHGAKVLEAVTRPCS
jgi:hypothetical protein